MYLGSLSNRHFPLSNPAAGGLQCYTWQAPENQNDGAKVVRARRTGHSLDYSVLRRLQWRIFVGRKKRFDSARVIRSFNTIERANKAEYNGLSAVETKSQVKRSGA